MRPTELSMSRGDSASWRFQVTDVDNPTGTDLSTVLGVRFTAKRRVSDVDADAVIRKTVGSGVTITDAATGMIEVALVPGDTSAETAACTLLWDIQVTGAASDPHTVASGTLRVDLDVTLTVP